jgi:hypothetical protein
MTQTTGKALCTTYASVQIMQSRGGNEYLSRRKEVLRDIGLDAAAAVVMIGEQEPQALRALLASDDAETRQLAGKVKGSLMAHMGERLISNNAVRFRNIQVM